MSSTTMAQGASISSARAWYMVGVVTLLYVLSFLDRAVLGLLAIPIKHDLGVSDVELSLLLGLAFALFYGVVSVPAGWLVDRFSRRAVIGGGVVLWSAMTMGCGLAANFWQLFIGRMGVGLGEAALSPASFSLIRNILPPESRGRAYAVYSLGPAIGAGLALLVGGVLLGALTANGGAEVPLFGHLRPWQAVLVLIGALGVPLAALSFTLREPVRQLVRLEVGTATSFGAALRFIGRNRAVYGPIGLFGALMSMVAFSYSAWMPTLIARSWQIAPREIGLRVGLISLVCSPIGAIATGYAMDRIVRQGRPDAMARVGFVTSAATLVFAAGIPFAPSFTAALVLIAAYLLVNGTFYAIGATALASVTPAHMMGKVTALYLLLAGVVGQALGPTVVAYVEELFTGPDALGYGLSLATGIMAIGGLLSLLWMRPALQAHVQEN